MATFSFTRVGDQDTASATRCCPHSEGFSSLSGSRAEANQIYIALVVNGWRPRRQWSAMKDLIFRIAIAFPTQPYVHNESSQAIRIRAFQEKFPCNRLTKRLVCGRRAQVGRGSLSWDRPRDQATLSSDFSSAYRPDSFPCSCARVACATNLTANARSLIPVIIEQKISPEQVNRSSASS